MRIAQVGTPRDKFFSLSIKNISLLIKAPCCFLVTLVFFISSLKGATFSLLAVTGGGITTYSKLNIYSIFCQNGIKNQSLKVFKENWNTTITPVNENDKIRMIKYIHIEGIQNNLKNNNHLINLGIELKNWKHISHGWAKLIYGYNTLCIVINLTFEIKFTLL